jgi:hypothetical protein
MMPTIMQPPGQFFHMHPMFTAEQHAMMRMHGGGNGMHGPPTMGVPMPIPMQPPMQIVLPPMQHPHLEQSSKPPISEININAETS